jgi:hypothetical protein
MNEEEGSEIPVNMEGWGWFNTVTQAAQRKMEARSGLSPQETIYHFEKCFRTPSGKIVMDHLSEVINATDDFDTALGFYNGAAHGFEKTGVRRLFKYIKSLATQRGDKK